MHPPLSSAATVRLALLVAALAPGIALAERVLVLPFTGDRSGAVRNQVDAELRKSPTIELVPMKELEAAFAARGLRTDGAPSPAAARVLAETLRLSVLVEGAVGQTFQLRIVDAKGEQLWTKELQLKSGRLLGEHAHRLAAAITAAAKTATPAGVASAGTSAVAEPSSTAAVAPAEGSDAGTSEAASTPSRVPAESAPAAPAQAALPPDPAEDDALLVAPLRVEEEPGVVPIVPVVPVPPRRPAAAAGAAAAASRADEPVLPPSNSPLPPSATPRSTARTPPVTGPPTTSPPPASSALPLAADPTIPPGAEGDFGLEPIPPPPGTAADLIPGTRRITRPKSMRTPGGLDWGATPPRRAVATTRGKARTGGRAPMVLRPVVRIAPPTFHLRLGGTGTLRSYCARPGVSQCADYDALPPADRLAAGPTADFSGVYPGAAASAELFPVAFLDNPLHGFGLLGGYMRNFSWSEHPGETAAGEPTTLPVFAIDQRWYLMAAFRWYFALDRARPVPGYVGFHGGYVSHGFVPERPESVFLPATRRNLWAAGIDVQLPASRHLKFELSASWYFNPGVIPEDAAALGVRTDGFGLHIEGGISGEIVGALGYFVRAGWSRFDDTFAAPGGAWPLGGVTSEAFVTLNGGLSLSF